MVTVTDGRVRCRAFPFVVITSNGERQFPPAFLLRRVQAFVERNRENGELATDQLLNAVHRPG